MARESGTDTVQEVAETTVHHMSRIAGIMATAARDIVTELGEMLNDVAQISSTKRADPAPAQPEPAPATPAASTQAPATAGPATPGPATAQPAPPAEPPVEE
jgi:hypothetical protein